MYQPSPYASLFTLAKAPLSRTCLPVISQLPLATIMVSLCLLLVTGCKQDNHAVTTLEISLSPLLIESGAKPVYTLRLWYKIEPSQGQRLTGNPDGDPLSISLAEPLNDKPHTIALNTMEQMDSKLALHIVGLGSDGTPHAHWSGTMAINRDRSQSINLVGWNDACDTDGDLFQDCSKAGCCPTLEKPDDQTLFTDCLDQAGDVTQQATLLVDPAETVAKLAHPFRSARFESADSAFCRDGLDNNCDGNSDDVCDFVDADQDGWDAKRDCDDNATDTYPGAPELCDGVDNNCNSLVDVDDPSIMLNQACELQAGVCQGAMKPITLCQDGAWQPCTDEHYSAHDPAWGEEICDGLDNNCDGLFDGDDPAILLDEPCENQDGVCFNAVKPAYLCAPGGTWQPCTEAEYQAHAPESYGREICDGLDNSCNGLTDQADQDLLLELCDIQVGACLGAMRTAELCVGGVWQPCNPYHYASHAPTLYGEELCDNVDNDCDGNTDGDDNSLVTPLCENQQGLCSGSRKTASLCDNGQWMPCAEDQYRSHHSNYGPEVCDTRDNNCDGSIDNVQGVGTPCSTGEQGACSEGILTCLGSRDFELVCHQNVTPTWERCNGRDMNCDGVVDNPSEACSTGKPGICAIGVQTCDLFVPPDTPGCEQVFQPALEICNSTDDDCDGIVDNPKGTCVYQGNLDECWEPGQTCDGATGTAPVCTAVPVENGAPCGSTPTHQCFMGECIDVPAGWAPIAPGTFTMGSPIGESGRASDETAHQVTITRPFLIKTTEVTNEEWRAMLPGTDPAAFWSSCPTNCPVQRVNWYEALYYLNRMSENVGLEKCYTLSNCSNSTKLGAGCGSNIECSRDTWTCTTVTFTGLDCTGYRLPTEAEWEYAARAGSTTAFHNGAATPDQIGWYSGNSNNKTHPVKQKTPNAWGLYDMHGNVWELTWDHKRVYASIPVTDPLSANTYSDRVIRGGSWFEYASECRAAMRYSFARNYRHYEIGFRPVKTMVIP